jgi:hypothetical protein
MGNKIIVSKCYTATTASRACLSRDEGFSFLPHQIYNCMQATQKKSEWEERGPGTPGGVGGGEGNVHGL